MTNFKDMKYSSPIQITGDPEKLKEFQDRIDKRAKEEMDEWYKLFAESLKNTPSYKSIFND